MKTYCNECKHVIQQGTVKGGGWLCEDTGIKDTLGIKTYRFCLKVNDDFKCSRFKPKWWIKLLRRRKK